MEEVASCQGQEPCRTHESSDQQEQEKLGNSEEEFQVEIMLSSQSLFEVPTAVQEEGRKCPTTESGGDSGGGNNRGRVHMPMVLRPRYASGDNGSPSICGRSARVRGLRG